MKKKIKQVVQLRKSLGLTQAYMAKKCNISLNSYQNKEAEKTEWTTKEMPLILEEIQLCYPEATADIFLKYKVYNS